MPHPFRPKPFWAHASDAHSTVDVASATTAAPAMRVPPPHATSPQTAPVASAGRPPKPEPAYLNTEEAAALLRVSRRTLERYRIEGGGPPYLRVGGAHRKRGPVRYIKRDVMAWLEAQTFRSTSEYAE